MLAFGIRPRRPIRFQKAIFLCAAMQRERLDSRRDSPQVAADAFRFSLSALGALAEAARCNLGLAGGFAAVRSLALVNAAAEAVDQP